MRTTTLRQQAYHRIREMLAFGELAAGSALSEPGLARELGMSRTPVREAIRQMEMEGLLDYAPRYGATVRVPGRDELAEMYGVREALECDASAEAARRIGPAEIERLRDLCRGMRKLARQFYTSGEPFMGGPLLKAFVAADIEFHHVVIRAGGNRFVLKILDETRLLARVFTSTFWRYDRRAVVEANRFHGRLLWALRQGDAEAARRATLEAMQVSKRNALAAWDQHGP